MSTSASKALPKSITTLLHKDAATIDTAARWIAHMMAEIHGGDWRVKVDHNAGFVLIVPNPNKKGGAS